MTMNRLVIDLPGREYDILIQRGLATQVGDHCRAALPGAARLAVVTDTNVAPLYGGTVCDSLLAAGFEVRLFPVPAGERSKSLDSLAALYDALFDFGLTRTDGIVALGGGVVGDLAGFAAATVLRGVPFIQIPTTLLAQVDSSVGGKVAVNVPSGKNLVGAFHQPRLVLMDPNCLKTLPDADFAGGMAEVIKYGCIADADFFAGLEARPSRAAVMEQIDTVLLRCCALKRDVVVQDEHDTGARMMLNFGHTLGHAYELAGGYERWTHGAAVAAGMCRAAALGECMGITPAGTAARIAALVSAFALPTAIPCTLEQYKNAIGLDKKGDGSQITLILLSALGRAVPVSLAKSALLAQLEEGAV